jgi:hypothetical protein
METPTLVCAAGNTGDTVPPTSRRSVAEVKLNPDGIAEVLKATAASVTTIGARLETLRMMKGGLNSGPRSVSPRGGVNRVDLCPEEVEKRMMSARTGLSQAAVARAVHPRISTFESKCARFFISKL